MWSFFSLSMQLTLLFLLFFFRFVEIMAPVFSREAWRCVWHMIQVYFIFHVPHDGYCNITE
jgi:hypothetical protein